MTESIELIIKRKKKNEKMFSSCTSAILNLLVVMYPQIKVFPKKYF